MLDALARARPVVASAVGGVPDVIMTHHRPAGAAGGRGGPRGDPRDSGGDAARRFGRNAAERMRDSSLVARGGRLRAVYEGAGASRASPRPASAHPGAARSMKQAAAPAAQDKGASGPGRRALTRATASWSRPERGACSGQACRCSHRPTVLVLGVNGFARSATGRLRSSSWWRPRLRLVLFVDRHASSGRPSARSWRRRSPFRCGRAFIFSATRRPGCGR
jgi:hypothetical protein